jgi:hypothetical protein
MLFLPKTVLASSDDPKGLTSRRKGGHGTGSQNKSKEGGELHGGDGFDYAGRVESENINLKGSRIGFTWTTTIR